MVHTPPPKSCLLQIRGRVIKVPGSRPGSRQRQQPSLQRPATSGAAAASKQRSAVSARPGAAAAAGASAATDRKRKTPAQQAQQAQLKMTAYGGKGGKKRGTTDGPGKLAALGKRTAAATRPGAQADSAQGPPDAAAAALGAGPARHVTWDESPQA